MWKKTCCLNRLKSKQSDLSCTLMFMYLSIQCSRLSLFVLMFWCMEHCGNTFFFSNDTFSVQILQIDWKEPEYQSISSEDEKLLQIHNCYVILFYFVGVTGIAAHCLSRFLLVTPKDSWVFVIGDVVVGCNWRTSRLLASLPSGIRGALELWHERG